MLVSVDRECVSCAFFCMCVFKGEDPFFPAWFFSTRLLFCSKCERIWMVRFKPTRVTHEMNKDCVVLLSSAADSRTWLGRCPACQTEAEKQRAVEKGGLPIVKSAVARRGSCALRIVGRIQYEPRV